MLFVQAGKSRTIEAIIYPFLLLLLMWLLYLLDHTLQLDLYLFGVKPRSIEGIKGILLMPLIHNNENVKHILSNSLPVFVLLCTLIYFYREIALRVFCYIWLGTGSLLWILAKNEGVYHIGMSGVIYGLFGFLLISGFLKKYLPLQAISLFVAFAYGSIVWGILPIKVGVSWQGHLSGLIIGVTLAILYRKQGPKRPKYAYEIEEEMGIEPPDFEHDLLSEKLNSSSTDEPNNSTTSQSIKIDVIYKPKEKP